MKDQDLPLPTIRYCPHCGGSSVELWQGEDDPELIELVNPDGYWSVICSFYRGGCGASGGYRKTEREAIEAWNMRSE